MRKQWNVIGFAIVCMGQLTVGVALQIALLLVGRHSWPLYALSGWLMGNLQGHTHRELTHAHYGESVTVRSSAELPAAFDRAIEVTQAGQPFLIDAKITDKRGLPVEELEFHVEGERFVESVNPNYNANGTLRHTDTVEEFFASYDGEGLLPMTHYFDQEGVRV